MKSRLLIAAGLVVIIVGAVFALQGFGVIEGSVMSNSHTYEVVGPLVALAGLVLAALGLRQRRSAAQLRPASGARDAADIAVARVRVGRTAAVAPIGSLGGGLVGGFIIAVRAGPAGRPGAVVAGDASVTVRGLYPEEDHGRYGFQGISGGLPSTYSSAEPGSSMIFPAGGSGAHATPSCQPGTGAGHMMPVRTTGYANCTNTYSVSPPDH
jgi:hypothetical protein